MTSLQNVILLVQFVLAMVLYPDAQRAAQEEIDQAVGLQRLPGFGDRESLPLVDCILKETLRWATPVSISKALSFHCDLSLTNRPQRLHTG